MRNLYNTRNESKLKLKAVEIGEMLVGLIMLIGIFLFSTAPIVVESVYLKLPSFMLVAVTLAIWGEKEKSKDSIITMLLFYVANVALLLISSGSVMVYLVYGSIFALLPLAVYVNTKIKEYDERLYLQEAVEDYREKGYVSLCYREILAKNNLLKERE